MADKIHIKDRNEPENVNKQMKERGWTAGTVFLAIFLFFLGILPGILYTCMKSKILKQKNRLVYDHNEKIKNNIPNNDLNKTSDKKQIN